VRTSSLRASRGIRERLRDREIGQRDIGERVIRERVIRKRVIGKKDIRKTVVTCEFNPHLLIHIHI
jgi:hypothetical protein